MFSTLIVIFVYPNILNKEIVPVGSDKLSKEDTAISWKKILSNRHSNFAIACCFMVTFVMTFSEGFFSEEFHEKGMEN